MSNLIRVRSFASMMNASLTCTWIYAADLKIADNFFKTKACRGIMVKYISLHALDYEHVQYLKNKKTTRSKMRITTLYTFCLFVFLFDLILYVPSTIFQ